MEARATIPREISPRWTNGGHNRRERVVLLYHLFFFSDKFHSPSIILSNRINICAIHRQASLQRGKDKFINRMFSSMLLSMSCLYLFDFSLPGFSNEIILLFSFFFVVNPICFPFDYLISPLIITYTLCVRIKCLVSSSFTHLRISIIYHLIQLFKNIYIFHD